HCTEADVSIQHFGLARELGLETVGFLMMSHTIPPEKLAQQARIMADAGRTLPFVIALVELAEGVRMLGELRGIDPARVRIEPPLFWASLMSSLVPTPGS
ncbi:OB-fold domain-containing protein, partial [Mycobacterium avium]|uniref:OB-fold domain-containing protein n=1 Tax=Mycobacterium avium TaxID=1764 RepID=UPI000A8FB089